MKITVRKKNDKAKYEDEYIADPEESIDILEHLRLETENFLYDKPVTFQRIITVVRGKYSDLEVNFLGINELIKNKEASGRPQDLVDAKKLKDIKKK